MKSTTASRPWPARALELGGLGAERAAAALASLVGRTISALGPEPDPGPGAAPAEAETGVLFEMEGALEGVVALLFSAPGRQSALEALGADTAPSVCQSALREIGNIVASQAVSAVADRLGESITISVPTLVNHDAGRVLQGLLARRGAPSVATSGLCEADGEPEAWLVFAPDAR